MATMAVSDLTQTEQSTVSWGAVVAGGMAAAALSLFLLALGVGLGLSSISPWSDQGVSATTFKVGTGIYIVLRRHAFVGRWRLPAGRLRATWAGVHNDEIYFRDTAHGLLAWAFATILGATALAAATTHIVAGAAAGLAPAAATAATSQGQPTDIYVDTLLRTEPRPAGADAQASNQSGAGAADPRAEVGRLIAPVLRKGARFRPPTARILRKSWPRAPASASPKPKSASTT